MFIFTVVGLGTTGVGERSCHHWEVSRKPSAPAGRRWLALLFLLSLGGGAFVIGLINLLVPFPIQAASVAPLSGKQYAVEQFGDFARDPWPIHIHVALGVLFVVLAAFQFWRKFRNRNLRLHRVMGYAAFACLILLPTTGVACSIIYPFGGALGVVPNVFWMVDHPGLRRAGLACGAPARYPRT